MQVKLMGFIGMSNQKGNLYCKDTKTPPISQ